MAHSLSSAYQEACDKKDNIPLHLKKTKYDYIPSEEEIISIILEEQKNNPKPDFLVESNGDTEKSHFKNSKEIQDELNKREYSYLDKQGNIKNSPVIGVW
ncbi:hypothetical protein PDN14_26940 [Bacillus cereus group sp. Bc222]|uniref:hypothetical protein n=1 Tax=Bacillus cereus group sp. Bc222 TaxID=3018111 RepID=UPI0022E84F0D|nr:hypothetical protein [Bacillus cereus group sp. Bc222]MDA2242011.1 hypothetical protein [Bacillus cereus group sp. Bc222]